MEKEELLKKKIRTIYTEIERRLVDRDFTFPEGGKVNIALSKFIKEFAKLCGGEFNTDRLVDYCVFQIHKNREAKYQRRLASNVFGKTAIEKYRSMSSKAKTFVEDKWLAEANLNRAYLKSLICNREHPQAKYIYMPSEEATKRRNINTEVGFLICQTSTLLWSPFSPTCQQCNNADRCKRETERNYPELYRIRLEEYDKRR